MKITLDPGAYMPTRAHAADAGLDLYARETVVIPAGGSGIFDTGVHVSLPAHTVGMLKSKSGLNVKKNLLCEGVIDEGYTGPIVAKLYNHGREDVTIEAGMKIVQLVILPVLTPELEIADCLDKTDRGDGGFGSTGS